MLLQWQQVVLEFVPFSAGFDDRIDLGVQGIQSLQYKFLVGHAGLLYANSTLGQVLPAMFIWGSKGSSCPVSSMFQ